MVFIAGVHGSLYIQGIFQSDGHGKYFHFHFVNDYIIISFVGHMYGLGDGRNAVVDHISHLDFHICKILVRSFWRFVVYNQRFACCRPLCILHGFRRDSFVPFPVEWRFCFLFNLIINKLEGRNILILSANVE